ncbi:MAG TPA: RIP metalloprotease RseP [Acetobacteraceae bacterium]|nr:RIP metalloprotease RseP [Acetobacteraceae bacterium]
MHTVPDLARTVVSFAVVLGVLVFVHEFGHYLAARWRGVHVEVFSIGFGKALASWTARSGTLWKVGWLPLGGYVKLHGQERPQDVSEEVRANWIAGQTFHEKSVLSRAIIVAAGPIANFVLAAVVFTLLFATVGRPLTLPIVGSVLPHSAAAQAGLQSGDRIVSIAGQPIHDFKDIQRIVTTRAGDRLSLTIERSGKQQQLSVTPQPHEVNGRDVGLLGISGSKMIYEQVSLPVAIWSGAAETWHVTAETVSGVAQMITGQRGTQDLGGPLRIAQLSGEVAALGAASMLSFIAVLSVNLGLINLFPIPILDGGHLLFYLFEAVLGRPLPARAQEYGFRAGLALLAGLFIFATWNDLTQFGLFHWMAGWMG